MMDVSTMRYQDWELWDVLPEGSPYRELVLNDEGDNRPELLLAVASMDVEDMLVSAVVAAGALWEEGAEGDDAENLERTLVLFAASDMSKVREAVGRVRGLPAKAFAALVQGSRRVRDNALTFVAMQDDVDGDVLHLAAVWGNDWAKDLAIKHPNVCEETLEAIAQGIGPVAANARRELDRRRADARRELDRRRGE
jgi:hypothetical protein